MWPNPQETAEEALTEVALNGKLHILRNVYSMDCADRYFQKPEM